ncbi:MAG: hypothetical protein IJN57_11420 [Oscillospiraceae bacterium]|nr:hypothetical protein [Oscillospiraceae bacterium]
MKKLSVIILALCLLLLSACSKIPAIEAQEDGGQNTPIQSDMESEAESETTTEESPDSHAVSDSDENAGTREEAGTQPAEEQASEPAQSPNPDPSQSEEEAPVQQKVPIHLEFVEVTPEESTEEQPETEIPVSEPDPVPEPEQPEPTPEPEPEPEPTPEYEPDPEPEPEPEPAFDVSTWVSFAISYGQQIGLTYDSGVTECWDNPIIASPNSIYLERDITSRLNRYLNRGMTAFGVWAQPRGDGAYDIYIAYA